MRFRGEFLATLIDEPIEDGITHPSEHVLEKALRIDPSECRKELSRILVEYQTRPSMTASIVRCIGRMEYDQVGQWGIRVAEDALGHKDIEVRDAAVRTLENWGGREAIGILRSHKDSVDWMNDYVSQVIIDLSEAEGLTIINDLAEVWEECQHANWDGYDALPVSQSSLRNMYKFLMELPPRFPRPTIGAEPGGHLTVEWYRHPRWTLSVSIGPEGTLHYSALLGSDKTCGTEAFYNEVPKSILDLVRRVLE